MRSVLFLYIFIFNFLICVKVSWYERKVLVAVLWVLLFILFFFVGLVVGGRYLFVEEVEVNAIVFFANYIVVEGGGVLVVAGFFVVGLFVERLFS